MATSSLETIEREFATLSPQVQLGLLERLIHQLRMSVSGPPDTWEDQLSAMAADPEIQRQLSRDKADFRVTERPFH